MRKRIIKPFLDGPIKPSAEKMAEMYAKFGNQMKLDRQLARFKQYKLNHGI